MDNLGVAINDTTLNMYALEKGIDKTTQEMTTQEKVGLAMELFMERTAYATGNYAKENDTLAGSLSTAKAALDNFLSGAGDATALADAFVDAAEVIILKLDTLLPALVTGIGQLVKKLGPKIPGLLKRLVPASVDAMSGIIKELLPQLPKMIAEIAPILIQGAKDLGMAMIEAIGDTIPVLEEIFDDFGIKMQDLLTIVGGLVLAFKGFSIVKTVSSAVSTLKTAFIGLNAVMASNPIGLLVSGLGLFVAAVAAGEQASKDALDPFNKLSEEEKKIRREAENATEALREMHKTFDEEAGSIKDETKRTEDLWKELQNLCDENGNVKEGYEERAAYIAKELSEATDEEILIIDGSVQKYKELAKAVNDAIKAKEANALLESYKEVYDNANESRTKARQDAETAEKNLDIADDELKAAKSALADFERENADILRDYNYDIANLYQNKGALALEWENLQNKVDDCSMSYLNHVAALDEANAAADEHYRAISYYEEAERAIAEGNYERAIEIMDSQTSYRWKQVVERGKASAEELAQLEKAMNDAYDEWQFAQKRHLEGNEAYSDATLVKYSQHYHELRKLWLEAAEDAEQAGKDIGSGIGRGLVLSKKETLLKAKELVQGTLNMMRETAQIASPSKITTEFGRFLVEGLGKGIEEEQHIPALAAADTMQRTISGFTQGLPASPAPVSAETYHEEFQSLSNKFDSLIRDLPEMMLEAFEAMQFKINNREFARMVRAVE